MRRFFRFPISGGKVPTIEASSKVLPTHHPHVRTYSPTRLGEPEEILSALSGSRFFTFCDSKKFQKTVTKSSLISRI
jgi:hypothetical protein